MSRYGRGSSGIATFATVLGVKNADCHTPPACSSPRWLEPLLRFKGFAALPSQVSQPYHPSVFAVCGGLSLCPLLTYIVYHKSGHLSIGFEKKVAQILYIFFVYIDERGYWDFVNKKFTI